MADDCDCFLILVNGPNICAYVIRRECSVPKGQIILPTYPQRCAPTCVGETGCRKERPTWPTAYDIYHRTQQNLQPLQ